MDEIDEERQQDDDDGGNKKTDDNQLLLPAQNIVERDGSDEHNSD